MSTEMVLHQPSVELPLAELGKVLAGSGFFADAKQASQAVVKVLAGREIGIGPITAMTGLNIIKGKVSLSANLMAGCIKRSGRYTYRVLKLANDGCELAFCDGAAEVGRSSFTTEDARRAELASGDNWRKYPRNMMFARALSNGARWYCPDLFGGPVYTPDELGQVVDETGELVVEYDAKQAKAAEVQAVIEAARGATQESTDGNGNSNAAPTAETVSTADANTKCSPQQRQDIIDLAKLLGLDAHELKMRVQVFGGERLADLSFDQAGKLYASLQRLQTEKEATNRF